VPQEAVVAADWVGSGHMVIVIAAAALHHTVAGNRRIETRRSDVEAMMVESPCQTGIGCQAKTYTADRSCSVTGVASASEMTRTRYTAVARPRLDMVD